MIDKIVLIGSGIVVLAMLAEPIIQFLFNREIAKERRYLDNNPVKEKT